MGPYCLWWGQRRNTPSDDPVVKVALKLVEDSVQNDIEVLLFCSPLPPDQSCGILFNIFKICF